jgi:hypothetical protein
MHISSVLSLFRPAAATAAVIAGLASSATAQEVLLSEPFESGTSGWTCNGEELISGGNPGNQLHVPYMDWYWIYFRNTETTSVATGNLLRHGGPLTFAVDVQVVQLNNWNNEPMDPNNFPLVIQLVDATDPNISVYFVGAGMPAQNAGWVRYTFTVPDPASTALPPGWGGTGAEDPMTFEPILPPGRTYTSVLQNVGEARLTTAVPGYFYVPSWWEVGFDNLLISVESSQPCYANCDGSSVAPILNVNDFTCFLNKFAAGDSAANCDGSSTAPILNVNDFTCFLNKFAVGCP